MSARTSDGEPSLPGLRGQATIQDVADDAGVSRAAVSKVIRDAYGVSPQMRTRVEAAIARLGYRPRVAARAMRGTSFTFGIEIAQLTNEFLTMIVQGALESLSPTPYQLVAAPIASPDQAEVALQSLADRQVDGIIAIAPRVAQDWLDDLARRIPLVMIGRHDVSAFYDTISGDDGSGADQVMRHLADLGHTRIAHLTIDMMAGEAPDDPSRWQRSGREPHAIRQRVYVESMRARGLQPTVVWTDGEEHHAEADTAELLRSPGRPTAIFAGNDTLAVGALRATAAAGLGPDEVSVVGYDDTTIASHPLVSLTSVDQHGAEMGREAVRLLLERVAGRTEPVRLESDVELRVRRSTARPRA